MIKKFSRWLFMKTHNRELIAVAREVRRLKKKAEHPDCRATDGLTMVGKTNGILDTLNDLNLLVR